MNYCLTHGEGAPGGEAAEDAHGEEQPRLRREAVLRAVVEHEDAQREGADEVDADGAPVEDGGPAAGT